ncbi:MAG: gfo/Idh/MocA family oxidoreductase, partial [Bacteroidales bacterium]|nr:gfo/Idh/MocA family oxidoreductase [Bacteroidales bacterium]
AVRNLEIFGEDLYISWEGVPESLYEYDFLNKENKQVKLYKDVQQLNDYSDFVIENAYYNEIINFFEVINKRDHPKYSFEKDKEFLNLIDKIESN